MSIRLAISACLWPNNALWRQAGGVPAASAGTHPAQEIDPGAIAAAQRHHLPLPRLRPASITDVREDGDLVVTVCDLAHEELGEPAALHWSVPDPAPAGDPGSFDAAVTELADRVRSLAPAPQRHTAPQFHRVQADFSYLLAQATPATLARRTSGTKWTNEQLRTRTVRRSRPGARAGFEVNPRLALRRPCARPKQDHEQLLVI